MRFYVCRKCGSIVTKIKDSGVPLMCCGEKMEELIPGETDAAMEKHVPVWKEEDGTVKVTVGEVEHPMLKEHHIAWILLETNMGCQLKKLPVTGKPEAVFALSEGEKAAAVYEYCNLHGLWKK